jgi:LAS superfamily LD-carboxypeptidase LdcB
MALLNNGNTAGAQDRLPPALKDRLGETDYPARVSVITAADAAALLALLPQIKQASQELNDLAESKGSGGAVQARLAIEKSETERWTEFYNQENNRDDMGAMTVEQSIASAVARTLEDPYTYTDPLGELNGSLKTLEAWLGRAVRTGRAVFFVYETN